MSSPDATKLTYSRLGPWRERFRQGVPILTYHKVGPRPRGARWRSLYLSTGSFSRQVAELQREGFRTSGLDEPFPAVDGNPGRRIVLSFDDGYRNVLTNAAPVLAAAGFSAIQFLVADRIGGRNEWDVAEGEVPEPLMSAAEVREWLAQGHRIGSHTLTHPRLTTLGEDELRREVGESRRRLEDRFGVPVRHFCFPYGDTDARVTEAVAAAGYETASLHLVSGVNTATTPRLALRRIEARYPRRNLRSLWRWLRGAADS